MQLVKKLNINNKTIKFPTFTKDFEDSTFFFAKYYKLLNCTDKNMRTVPPH
jgi:hypothetical protein